MSERDFLEKFLIKYQETVPEVMKAYKGGIEFAGFKYTTGIIKRAMKLFEDYSFQQIEANHPTAILNPSSDVFQVESFPSWYPPQSGILKINVDGAVKNSMGSCATVARNFEGVFKGGFAKYLSYCSVIEAEANAILSGLCLALTLFAEDVIIEGDSKSIINYINGYATPIPWKIKSIIQDILHLSKNFKSISFLFISRKFNSVAHDAFACMSPKFWCEYNPPNSIVNSLRADLTALA